MDITAFIPKHADDIIIIIPSTYYGYNKLIDRISSAMPNKKFIFMTDVDNWGNTKTENVSKALTLNYQSYRFVPASFNQYAVKFKNFTHSYFLLYHTEPTDAVSYMTYVTVMSAISALHQFHNADTPMRKKLLSSYLSALNKNQNWYRAKNYTVYRLTPQGEVLDEVLPLEKLSE